MNVQLFSRLLMGFIILTAAYSFYLDYSYVYSVLANPEYLTLHFVVLLGWYYLSFRALTGLFRSEPGGWYLGNAWLVYDITSRITSFIAMRYVYEVDYSGEAVGMFFLFLYLVAWSFFNKGEFKEHFRTTPENRALSTWIPVAVALGILVYNALTLE